MKQINNKGGRPKKDNPRTIVSEVYLTQDEAEELRAAGKEFGYPYLSQFLRVASFALINQKSIGLDLQSATVAAHLGAIASDVNSLHELSSRTGMPEAAFLISSSAQDKIRKVYTLINNNNNK